MKKLLMLCIATTVSVSCKKTDNAIPDATPVVTNTDKKVKIEVGFTGDYQNYQLLFGVTSLYKEKNVFAQPTISIPQNAQWTQIITQGNAYNYISNLTSNQFVIESKEPVNSISFLLSATQARNTDDVNAKPIVAIVKVYANEKVVETYTYKAGPVSEVTEPLSRSLNIGAYK